MKSNEISAKKVLLSINKSIEGEGKNLSKLEAKQPEAEKKVSVETDVVKGAKLSHALTEASVGVNSYLDTINKSLDTIDGIVKSYTALAEKVLNKSVEVEESAEKAVKEDCDEEKDCEKPEDKKVKKSEDDSAEDDDSEDEEESAPKKEDVKKDFEELKEEEDVAKSVSVEEGTKVSAELQENIDELTGVINKSLESLSEEDERTSKLQELKKSIAEDKEINEENLNKYIEIYTGI